jgi:hypothetical protein
VRGRLFVTLPLVAAAAYLVAQALVPDGARAGFFAAEVALAKLIGLVGCTLAASRYRRGEYLHVAWTLLAVHYALLIVEELAFGWVVHLPGLDEHALVVGRSVCIIAANLAASLCAILLARLWRLAGMALPSPATQRLAVGLALVAALALVGWGIAKDVRHLAGGDRGAIIAIASDVGDLVGFAVIAPLSLVALAMRGGTLFWPWALITASYVAWLGYDMTWSFQAQLGLGERTLTTLAELWRCLACALALSAGLAQRRALRPPRGEPRRAPG